MARIPERTVEEIRTRTDLVDLIGAHVRLKRAGQNFIGRCPFHNEKTPSFNVSPSRQRYHCFGCGEDGDCFKFLMQHNGMTFVDAISHLAERVGVTIETEEDDGHTRLRKTLQEIHAELTSFFQRCLLQMPHAAHARDYISQRALDPAIESFQIGYAPKRWDVIERWAQKNHHDIALLEQAGLVKRSPRARSASGVYDRFRDRLMFPICDVQGRVVAFSGRILDSTDDRSAKYINSPETPIFTKSRILYGLDQARRHIVSATNREAVICEGQIDVIRCHLSGISTAVAAQGTAFSQQHVEILRRYADSAVLVFDRDKAGLKAAIRTARLFLAAGLPARIASLPEGEDPDSFLTTTGADAFRAALDDAVSPVRFEIEVLREAEQHPDAVDAVSRISRVVIETLSDCTNAILRARLLQEAAEALALPEAALQQELEREEQRREEQQARRDGYAATVHQPNVEDPLEVALPTTEEPRPSTDEELLEPLDDWDGVDTLDPMGEEIPSELDADTPSAPPPPLTVSTAERLLCECVVHWINNRELVELAIELVPLEILRHPHASAIFAAIVESHHDGGDAIELLRTTAPLEVGQFLQEIETSPPKATGREFSPLDATRDAIIGLWRDHLRHERSSLNAADAESLARRQHISILLRKLRSWDEGEHVIAVEKSLLHGG